MKPVLLYQSTLPCKFSVNSIKLEPAYKTRKYRRLIYLLVELNYLYTRTYVLQYSYSTDFFYPRFYNYIYSHFIKNITYVGIFTQTILISSEPTNVRLSPPKHRNPIAFCGYQRGYDVKCETYHYNSVNPQHESVQSKKSMPMV